MATFNHVYPNVTCLKDKKAVVIGGAGFLGGHMIEGLLAVGVSKVVVFDIVNISHPSDRVESVKGDLRNINDLLPVFQGAFVVYNIASPDPLSANEALLRAVNIDGAKVINEACKQAGVERLVLTSSCSVLWSGDNLLNADETFPYAHSPFDPYTATKIEQERITLAANDPAGKFRTAAIRPHTIYGPRDKIFSSMAQRAHDNNLKFAIGNGKNLVDFTFVSNVVYGHFLATEHLERGGIACGKAFNVTDDEHMPFWEFSNRILRKMNKPEIAYYMNFHLILFVATVVNFFVQLLKPVVKLNVTFSPHVVRLVGTDHTYNITRAKKELGYRPLVSTQEGIEICLNAMKF